MANYKELVDGVRGAFYSSRTKTIEWRRGQLKAMMRLIDENEDALCEALKTDLRKSCNEARWMEIYFSRNEIVTALNNLEKWTEPRKVTKNMMTMMDTCYIRPEPYGVALIMGAWNYPVQLTLCPMIGAISAGNCVVLKPSEVSEHTAVILEKLIPKYMDQDAIKVVNGGVPETTALLKERFDYIFYTGNTSVGKIVMKAASEYLTPVTLELGGKSPVFVDKSSDIDVAARRILWGKFANTGQTCIAPDYVMCEDSIKDKLVERMKATLQEFYGEDPKKSNDLGRIVNNRHFKRVKALIDSKKVVHGGKMDESSNYISPTVMADVTPDDNIMKDEIFGPVLPIMTVKSLDDAIQFVNGREKPLALYIFSKDDSVIDRMIVNTSSGGLCVNDTVMHAALDTLPFGGVGHSGTGAYHGQFTFDTFSHLRSCMIKKQSMESVNKIRYPPFTAKKSDWMSWIMKKEPKKKGILSKFFPVVILGVIAALLFKLLGYPTRLLGLTPPGDKK